eukprot:TRINITY_DN16324_c0_g1_i1.p1 TRINITY_DN16324_c0_g1~~TRINITY_DN16324_c0_g1_i1.p1  ORF type:complete len:145 (-),score=32.29 TRINITY_DN16324_c0_g1_i1:207-641(-)
MPEHSKRIVSTPRERQSLTGDELEADKLLVEMTKMINNPAHSLGEPDIQYTVHALKLHSKHVAVQRRGLKLLIRLSSEFAGSETVLLDSGVRDVLAASAALAASLGDEELDFLTQRLTSVLAPVSASESPAPRGNNAKDGCRCC